MFRAPKSSLLVLLNLHLKLRAQTEALTGLARAIAIGEALHAGSEGRPVECAAPSDKASGTG